MLLNGFLNDNDVIVILTGMQNISVNLNGRNMKKSFCEDFRRNFRRDGLTNKKTRIRLFLANLKDGFLSKEFKAAIEEGLRDAKDGRITSHEEVWKKYADYLFPDNNKKKKKQAI